MSLLSRVGWTANQTVAQPPPLAPVEAAAADRVTDGRYVTVISKTAQGEFGPALVASATKLFEDKMSLVPAGNTVLQLNTGCSGPSDDPLDGVGRSVAVADFYMDRFAVTNADFLHFANAGGYRNMDLWPRAIWSNVIQFVDQTGKPGPKFWSGGKPKRGTMDHPVVGVSWFEATAYACWTGKQLPTSAQWQHAGTWKGDPSRNERFARYPWGNGSSANRANIFAAGKRTTVPVNDYYDGCTSNGIYQLVGNVWEWTASRFSFDQNDASVDTQSALAEIRGGAFDTYFESQASCVARSGQPLLHRCNNLGFRLCVPTAQITR